MKIGTKIVTVAAIMTSGWVWAGPVDTNQTMEQIRLDLDLTDGSRVIGVPTVTVIPIQTPYAKMDIPLRQIMTIEIGQDHEQASIALRNGDSLKGVINLGPVALDTLFGNVKIGIEIVKRARVLLSGGTLSDAVRRGLLLHYPFDTDTKDKVADVSGNGRDGIVKGARWTPKGKIGAACAFDGANSYISLPDASSLDMDSTSFTIGLYAYFNVTDQQRHRIVDLNPVIAGYSGLLIQQYGNSLLFFASSSGTSWDIADGVPIGSITAGQWYCVVVKRDGNTISTFLNDVAGGSVTSSSSLYHGTYGFDIGRFGPGNCEYFDGLLDEVMIFNRALSEKEVKQIYKVQK